MPRLGPERIANAKRVFCSSEMAPARLSSLVWIWHVRHAIRPDQAGIDGGVDVVAAFMHRDQRFSRAQAAISAR